MRPALLGLDGGGTKTAVLITTPDGREVLGRSLVGGINPTGIGFDAAGAVFRKAVTRASEGGPFEILSACLGMGGVGDPENARRMRAEALRVLQSLPGGLTFAPGAPLIVVGDMVIALWAGAPGVPGIVIISGTGAIGYGRSAAGRVWRAGGWGVTAEAEGAGGHIGRAALEAVVRAADGRGPDTLLRDLICKEIGRDPVREDLPAELYRWRRGGGTYTGFPPLAVDAALMGDPVAAGILDSAAGELALMVDAIARKLALDGAPFRVICVGSVLKYAHPVTEGFTRRVMARHPDAEVCVLARDPVWGAVEMALAALEGKIDDEGR